MDAWRHHCRRQRQLKLRLLGTKTRCGAVELLVEKERSVRAVRPGALATLVAGVCGPGTDTSERGALCSVLCVLKVF